MENLSRLRACRSRTSPCNVSGDAEADLPRLSRLPLAAACLLLFAASADMACAAPLPVSNCNDAGSGSLRASIASAASGDTITIPSNLGCSKITLTTGALAVTQDALTIDGPGAGALTITGKYTSPRRTRRRSITASSRTREPAGSKSTA